MATEVDGAESIFVAEKVKKENPRSKYYKWIFLGVGILIALIVGLSVGLTKSPSSATAPPVDVCDESQQPSVLVQCDCQDTIYYLSDESIAGYENITQTLLDTDIAVDNVYDAFACEPSTMARHYLATLPPMSRLDLHQTYALAVFYLSLNGDNWTANTNWLSSNRSVCDEWAGVRCDPDDNAIVFTVQLPSSNLVGTLPSEIAILSDLKSFYADNNQITGTIPTEIASLECHTFAFEENQLSGPFRPELFSPFVKNLRVHTNQLTGTIPTNLDTFADLSRLMLHTNHFTGTLPTELGIMRRVRNLDFGLNNFTGTLPTEFSNFRALEYLRVSNNSLTGTVPDVYANFTLLETFRFEGNDFVGTVPEVWCESFLSPVQIAGDCNENFSTNCSCCTCYTPDLDLFDG